MKKLHSLQIAMLIIIAIIAVGIVYYSSYQTQLLEKTQDSVQVFKSIVTDRGELIARQEQEIISMKEFREHDKELIKQLREDGIKKISTIVRLETENKRLNIELSYKPDTIIDTLVIAEGPDLKTYLRVPKAFTYDDKWLRVAGTVKTTNVTLDSISIFSSPQIVLGYSTGFFKKSVPIVDFSDNNPYTIVSSMQNNIIIHKPPFYKRPWFYRVEGAVGVVTVQYAIWKLANQ